VPAFTASSDFPKFSTPEVQKFVEEYSAFIKEGRATAKSGDAKNIQNFTAKWVTKCQSVIAKMMPEDAKLSQQMMSR
jgi:hypothetical protein